MKTTELKEIERKAFKAALKSKGVTLTELAQKLGITNSGLSSMMSRGVSSGLYARAAAALGCQIDDLKPAALRTEDTAKPVANGRRLTFDYRCQNCGAVHSITITIAAAELP